MKRRDEHACEMTRMFVPTMARGRGVGRALADALLEQARASYYREMYLDTSIRQTEAIALYRDLGFEEVEPYDDVPVEMLGWLTFFHLDLSAVSGSAAGSALPGRPSRRGRRPR
jgi:L-amino acid N-acyltransferase YncA